MQPTNLSLNAIQQKEQFNSLNEMDGSLHSLSYYCHQSYWHFLHRSICTISLVQSKDAFNITLSCKKSSVTFLLHTLLLHSRNTNVYAYTKCICVSTNIQRAVICLPKYAFPALESCIVGLLYSCNRGHLCHSAIICLEQCAKSLPITLHTPQFFACF